MKKLFSSLFVILLLFSLHANDAYFYMAGGQLVPTQEKDIEVEMVEEVINIDLNFDYYEITVDFFFYNYGKTVDLEIGFPFFCVGNASGYEGGKISDFKCWTNGIETSFVDYPIEKNWQKDTQLENAYVRTIKFPSKEITKTKISYKSTYGAAAPSYRIVQYLYGTGSCWKNAIGKMTVKIQNNYEYKGIPYDFLNRVTLPPNSTVTRTGENSWECVATNVEPASYTSCITIWLGNIFQDNGPRILSKDRFFASKKVIPEKDLFWYTKPQLRLLRNAIYSFHGYPFKSQDLIDFFEKEMADWGWYRPDHYPLDKDFSEDKLSDIEKQNVKTILEEENKFNLIK